MSLARRAQGALLVAIVSSPVALGACGDSGIERGSTGSLAAAASPAASLGGGGGGGGGAAPPPPPPPKNQNFAGNAEGKSHSPTPGL